ncbi:hypothetical protein [Agromyces sp. LHK192]|uniref:hypothetical protein n=1 Tax=Agromyces sp. LHK192 TaxID=2498704 RepID=UPI000FDA6954|nr:hypothetical protein [Agromyces sp. LHK192]
MTAAAPGPVPSPDDGDRPAPALSDAQRALRAQLLATEHWSLLASRSTTQSEVLTRIAILLTLVSAGLVTLGVLGNATAFRDWSGAAALGVLFLLVLLGIVTQLRVFNTMSEDLAYVLAMNRIRAAYVDLDPGVERYLLTGTADDLQGATRTYYPFAVRDRTQVLASSAMLVVLTTSAIDGLFVGALLFTLTASTGWAIGVGTAVAVAAIVASMSLGYRSFVRVQRTHVPLRRTPGTGSV